MRNPALQDDPSSVKSAKTRPMSYTCRLSAVQNEGFAFQKDNCSIVCSELISQEHQPPNPIVTDKRVQNTLSCPSRVTLSEALCRWPVWPPSRAVVILRFQH